MSGDLGPIAFAVAGLALAVLTIVQGLLLGWALGTPRVRLALGRALRHAPRRGASRFWLRRGLAGIDRLLRPGDVVHEPRPGRGGLAGVIWQLTPRASSPLAATAALRQPLGWPVADLAMKLAVACPLLLVALEWALTAEAVRLGGLPLLPGHPGVGLRLGVAGLAGLLLLSVLPMADRLGVALQVGLLGLLALLLGGIVIGAAMMLAATGIVAVSIAVAVAAAGGVAVLVGIAGSAAGAIAGALAFAAVFALTAAIAGAVAFAAAGSVGVAVAGIVSMVGAAILGVAMLLPLTGGLVTALSGSGAMALVVAAVLAVAAASAGTGALPYLLAVLVTGFGLFGVASWVRRGGGVVAYAAHFLLLAATVAGAGALVADGADGAIGLIVVLGLLPLVNAVGDALAIGKGRVLARLAARRAALIVPLLVLDVLVGFLLLAGCGALALAGVHGLNLVHQMAGASVPVLDLDALFADFAAPGALWRHGWLLGALSTVLLPSLLMAGMATFGAAAGMAAIPLRRLGAAFPRHGEPWRAAALARVAGTLWAAAVVGTAIPLGLLASLAAMLPYLMPALPMTLPAA